MSKGKTTRRSRRLNRNALITLGGVALLAVLGMVGLKVYQERGGRKAYLVEARKRIEQRKPNLALGYVNRHLELNPDDLEGLELKAQVLSDGAVTEDQAKEAVQVLSQVLGRTPKGPRSRDARRRLVKLSLKMRDRAVSAEKEAAKLIAEDGADDAEAHRLHARALETVGLAEKDPVKLDQARKEYEAAEAKDPGDVSGAEQLASLYRELLDDRSKAAQVLDKLVAGTAKTKDPAKYAAALLARAQHYAKVSQTPEVEAAEKLDAARKAEADVVAAVKVAPLDVNARLAAAELAVQAPRYNTADARLHLAAIPVEKRNDLRVMTMEGLIGLVERRPDDAIRAWRAGLVMAGGTDDQLTWRLANILLESGRVAEAEPLVEQYRRLTGGDTPDPRYRYLHGLALLRTNHPREAVTEFEAIRYKVKKAIEPHVWYALGQAYEGVREPAKALDAYRQAAEMSPEWATPWTAVARMQAETDVAAAEATLRRGLALMPNDARLSTALAQVLWSQQVRKPEAERSWGEVERVLESARKAAPGSAEVALVQADFFNATRRPDDAVATLRTAAGLNPRASELWLALANMLARGKHLGEALEVLDRGMSDAAAGPQAGLVITRAQFLVFKGLVAEARKTLIDALDKVPAGQKPLLHKTLGDFYLLQKDYTAARASYEDWGRLEPDNPEPRVSLLQLALSSGDDEALARSVESLKGVGGPKSYYWRYARIEELLRDRTKGATDPARDKARLDEAEGLVKEIQTNDPQIPLGYLLGARVAEKRGETDRAISDYKKALDLKAGPVALNPLVSLLIRTGRDAELERVRKDYAPDASEFDRLAAVQALRVGNKGRAEVLADMAVQGNPQGLDVRVWQAEVLKALGKPKEAEASLRKTIDRRPAEPAPWLSLLMLQISQRKTAEAAETVDQIRRQVESDTKELLLAQCYRSVGDFGRADECYRQALKKWPNDRSVLASAITFYEQRGRRDEAEAALRAMRRRDPSNVWATRKLALTLAGRAGNRGAWDEAVALVGADRRPDDVPEDLITRASVYGSGPEPAHRAKAVAILEGLLAELPNLPQVHEQVARYLSAAGDTARARDHAAKAAAGDAAGPDAILLYAGLLLTSGEVNGAEEQLNRLISLDPESLPVAELKARIMAARGKPAEAAQVLEKAFADRSATPDAQAVGKMMVTLLSSLPFAQHEAAERVARRLAALGPRGRCVLAEYLAGRGKADEAAAEIEAVAAAGESSAAGTVALNLAVRPGADPRWLALADKYLGPAAAAGGQSADRLAQLALLRHMKGDFAKEIATYEEIIAAGPSNFQFLNNMAWTLSEELRRPQDALKRVDEAIQRLGPMPEVLDTRGVILTRLGKLDDAIKDLESASGRIKDPVIDYHLARAYLKKGDPDAARKYRDRAREAGLTPERLQPGDRADWQEVMK